MCPTEAAGAEIAWNGVALRHPATWEVTRLDGDGIQWCEGPRPTLEIRWARHRGRWDEGRALRRFRRGAKRKGLPRPEPWAVPRRWLAGLAPLRGTGFSWRANAAEGRGLLVFCPRCRRQSLLLIHPHLAAQPDRIPPLLASFRDHPHGEEIPLNLFGLRAALPQGARLTRFRFDAGRYRLHWRLGRLRIGLHRWAPAGILLARQPLAAFAGERFGLPDSGLIPARHGDFDAVGLNGDLASGIRAATFLGPFLPRRMLRIWHRPDHNSLLGIEVRGRGRGAAAIFERLCDSYETF